jgi:hypothetical protein
VSPSPRDVRPLQRARIRGSGSRGLGQDAAGGPARGNASAPHARALPSPHRRRAQQIGKKAACIATTCHFLVRAQFASSAISLPCTFDMIVSSADSKTAEVRNQNTRSKTGVHAGGIQRALGRITPSFTLSQPANRSQRRLIDEGLIGRNTRRCTSSAARPHLIGCCPLAAEVRRRSQFHSSGRLDFSSSSQRRNREGRSTIRQRRHPRRKCNT